MAQLYPVFFNLQGIPCLVVGGGKVALRKVKGLLEAGAVVTVVAPEIEPELEKLAQSRRIEIEKRTFYKEAVGERWLVFCATDDDRVSGAVHEACEKARIPVNVADVPELCRFQLPARYREGDFQVAISTSGASPALGRRLKQEVKESFGPWAPCLAAWLSELRASLKERRPHDAPWRSAFLNRFMDTHYNTLKEWARSRDRSAFEALVRRELENE